MKNWTNLEISKVLKDIVAAYIIKKENRFKIAAYQRAASVIENSPTELKDLWDEGKLESLPGIGKNIAAHIDELFKTGKADHFNEIKSSLPSAMFEFLKIPNVGPKYAYKLCINLQIKDKKGAFKKLKKAAREGKIRKIEGFGEKSEKEILEGLNLIKSKKKTRFLLVKAENIACNVLDYLRKCPEVEKAEILGSLRRKCATIGDIDLAVASRKPEKVINWFVEYPKKTKIIETGHTKASILIPGNIQIDLRVVSPNSFGSLLQHFTGSKQHNIHLREIALKRSLSLSEYGIRKLTNKKNLKQENNKIIKFKNEEDFYDFIGLRWISPELREDTGEIEASVRQAQGKKPGLPKLIKMGDIKGDLHLHSNFNIETSHDIGEDSITDLAEKAKELNYQYIALSEHNPSLLKHNEKQIMSIIKRKKHKIEQYLYTYEKSKIKRKNKLFIFNSLEIDIKPNGKRAISDKAINLLDFAIVSIHSSFRLNKTKMTDRIIKGLDHPKVKILGHPTGRLLNKREGYEVDWIKIFKYCHKYKKILEINAYPDRLDLPDKLVYEAIKNKIKLVISTDSNKKDQMELMKYGVFAARKGWAEKDDIINTRNLDDIKKILISD